MTRTNHGTNEIDLPERLDFEENFELTASKFHALRKASIARVPINKLNFDKIRYISPAAALVLASEVDRWSQRLGRRLRALVDTWDGEIKRLLYEMGYFELLRISKPYMDGQPKKVTFLHFIRGSSDIRDQGSLAKELRKKIESIVGMEINRHLLFEGLSEAISNVGQHAYPPSNVIGRKKQWWLSASYDRQERRLVVMFYDQGDGIPRTLPTKWIHFESLKDIFGRMSDSEKIEAAVEYGSTATRRPERGKGLQNLIAFARAHDEGKLSIYSLKGLYRITPSDNAARPIRRNHTASIGGTLIEWSVKL